MGVSQASSIVTFETVFQIYCIWKRIWQFEWISRKHTKSNGI